MAQETPDTSGAIAWLVLDDRRHERDIADFLVGELDMTVVTGETLPSQGPVHIGVFDDKSAGCIDQLPAAGAALRQCVLLSREAQSYPGADVVMPHNTPLDSLKSVLCSSKDFRDQITDLTQDLKGRTSAVGSILSGQFRIKTLSEARNLATMLATACPEPDAVAVGLQELLVNAIEHGNLEIDSAMKRKLLMKGRLHEEIERRLTNPAYEERSVLITFERGDRVISFIIQDDGNGFDHTKMAEPEEIVGELHGRGIALARELSFSSVTYLSVGNIVQASIIIEPEEDVFELPGRAMTAR